MSSSANIFTATLKYFFIELIGDILYFPLWWYSEGLRSVALGLWREAEQTANYLALRLLLLNLLRPMYGQYDREGRIISFFMRLIILIGRSIYFFAYVAVLLILLVTWVTLPVIITVRVATIFFRYG